MTSGGKLHGAHAEKTAHVLSRILIASYFIAKSCGLVVDAEGNELVLMAPLPDSIYSAFDTGFVFVTAYALMIGYRTRTAALMLALYVFWTSFVVNYTIGETPMLSAFWRDLALIGGLLMTSIHSQAHATVRRRRKGTAMRPRRITPPGSSARTARPTAKVAHAPVADLAGAMVGKLPAAPVHEVVDNLFRPEAFPATAAVRRGA